MDDIDIAILKHLCRDCRTHNTEIAKELGIAPSTVHKRINHLVQSNVVERFVAVLDPSKLGHTLTTYIGINIEPSKKIAIINRLERIPDVLEIYELLEPYDLFIKVRTFNIISLKKNVISVLHTTDGVIDTSTILTTKRHKEMPTAILTD
ncbi:MAG: Lrp/AsnC family transcriptional regulator [Methanosarcinales archaeon]|nr:Lrp/AsnC family transcriptional regulator [Methanosarcinales archaeon]